MIEFYQHDLEWENRLILGDSLVVMTSLLKRERLGGRVQCVFIDPPYGINFSLNAQRLISDKKRFGDANDKGYSREPEAIQAYRDTWELGLHSYLTHLRDRFLVVRELLGDEGSVFVQINEENVHLIRMLLDEVFGAANFVRMITYQKTTGSGSPNTQPKVLSGVADFIVWYAKDKSSAKYRHLYLPKKLGGPGASGYTHLEHKDGTVETLTSAQKAGVGQVPRGSRPFNADNMTSSSGVDKGRFEVTIDERTFRPDPGVWKTDEEGMQRLIDAGRIIPSEDGATLGYKRYLGDFPAFDLNNVWSDTVGQNQHGGFNRYVVQTVLRAVRRCVLMTTDPGDLVIDPTCGSGSTAFVCEEYGRRWITIDTSRVALALARERLLTAKYPYFKLRDEARGVGGGFMLQQADKTMLKTIARGDPPESVAFHDRPQINKQKVRVSGPFTLEALSRYAIDPYDPAEHTAAATDGDIAADHVAQLLKALEAQGIPRPDDQPLKISSLDRITGTGRLHAEGTYETAEGSKSFAVALGPRFGTITPTQVHESLQEAHGYDLVVFAGFAAHVETQELLNRGRVGRYDVALLIANPDLLLGSLLKSTVSSQTFRLYASPDLTIDQTAEGWVVTVDGVDYYDAATREVKSSAPNNVRAWFLDTNYDGMVFRIDQAFFPHTTSWDALARALKATLDAGVLDSFKGFKSIPFHAGDKQRCAVRVITDDGNAAEAILSLNGDRP